MLEQLSSHVEAQVAFVICGFVYLGALTITAGATIYNVTWEICKVWSKSIEHRAEHEIGPK